MAVCNPHSSRHSSPGRNVLSRKAFQQGSSKLEWGMGRPMLTLRTALGVAASLLALTPAGAQYIGGSPPPLPDKPIGAESAPDALARNVRILAQSPRDYAALVGAGRAALETGDAEAAVGFFGRAADVWPSAPAPKSGMGAALAAMGEAAQALPLFDQAQRAGASVAGFAADRGLARDLLGQQALAQADYRLALTGPDAAEARRRLALSQAISGDRSGALATLSPLRADPATNRTRAFVLALGGDADSADRTLDAMMPGMASRLDPFFRRLASLSPAQKAAAVHLGIMPGVGAAPGAGQLAVGSPSPPAVSAYAAPVSRQLAPAPTLAVPVARSSRPPAQRQAYGPTERQPSPATGAPATGDRLAEIDALLRVGQGVAPPPPAAVPAPAPRRFWVQLASGPDTNALGAQFARIAARDPDLFKGISPYVAETGGRSKLLVGPFHSSADSTTFVENLNDSHIDGFSWTSPEGQPVRKLAAP
jgi:Flp pilus assembly protein TadD